MKHLRLTVPLVVLLVLLAGCLPGLGTLDPVDVQVASPHIAVATYTPAQSVIDVIVSFAGGDIDVVRPVDPRFQCQEFRGGWDCFVTGQDDAAAPRVVHEAGAPITFNVYADDATSVVATVFYRVQ